MAYTSQGRIEATHFNDFLTRAAALYGTGFGDYGYGQTSISQSSAAPQTKILRTQWNNLLGMTQKCLDHSTFNPGVSPTVGNVIAVENISDMLTVAETNRLIAQPGSMTLVASVHQNDILTTWNGSMYAKYDAVFTSENAARYFFNSGGQLRIRLTHPNGSSAADVELRSGVIARVGTIGFTARATWGNGTAARSTQRGYYNLLDTYQVVYDGTNLGAGAYANMDVMVLARRLSYGGVNGGNGSGIRFVVSINPDPPDDTLAAGTRAAFDTYRATTHLVGITTATFSTTVAWVAGVPPVEGAGD